MASYNKRGSQQRGKNAQGGPHLEEALRLLPTPNADDTRPNSQPPADTKRQTRLSDTLRLLPTPSAEFTDVPDRQTFLDRRERERARGRNGNGFGLTLPMALTLLPTPTTMDAGGSRGHRLDGSKYTETSGTTLTDAVFKSVGVHTSPLSEGGKKSSVDLTLNPFFVEWMMGAPAGWSDPDCPLSAMEFSSRPDGSADDESSSTSGVCAND